MAHIYVKNSLSNLKNVKLDINISKFVSTTSDGDFIWLVEVSTTYPSASGTSIRPAYINKVTDFEDLDEAIADSVSKISSQIDWLPLVKDDSSPYVSRCSPVGNNISIASNIDINIKDIMPSSGIDLSNIKVILNNGIVDIDITKECKIEGNPLDYDIHWEPSHRLTKHYD